MPLVPHVTPGSVIASSWGNLVADHVVMRFTTAAQRTSLLTAPINGQLTTLDSRPGIIDAWSGTAWVPIPGLREVSFAATPNASAPLGGGGTHFPFSVTVPIAGTLVLEGQAAVYRAVPGVDNSSAVIKAQQASGGPVPNGLDTNFQIAPDLGWSTVPFRAAYPAVAAGVVNLGINFLITSINMKLFNYQGTVRVQPT